MRWPGVLTHARKRARSLGHIDRPSAPDDLDSDLILQTLREHRIHYVHGSRTPSLPGVAQHGGLLSALGLHGKYPNPDDGEWLPTGEQFFTRYALDLYFSGQELQPEDECNLHGVSLHPTPEYAKSWWFYANHRASANTHKVLYGVRDVDVRYIAGISYRHHYATDAIPADSIKAVFVAPSRVAGIKADLELAGYPEMAAKITPIVSPRSARVPMRRHSIPATCSIRDGLFAGF